VIKVKHYKVQQQIWKVIKCHDATVSNTQKRQNIVAAVSFTAHFLSWPQMYFASHFKVLQGSSHFTV